MMTFIMVHIATGIFHAILFKINVSNKIQQVFQLFVRCIQRLLWKMDSWLRPCEVSLDFYWDESIILHESFGIIFLFQISNHLLDGSFRKLLSQDFEGRLDIGNCRFIQLETFERFPLLPNTLGENEVTYVSKNWKHAMITFIFSSVPISVKNDCNIIFFCYFGIEKKLL